MKTSVYIATTLDGFIARQNGSLDWLPGSDGTPGEEDYGYHTFIDSVDVIVMGRRTYEMICAFGGEWPYGERRVIVLSTTLGTLPATLPETVELRSQSPESLFSELEDAGAQHLYVDGGRTIQGFLEAGLIHELIITRVPVLIGSGIPLFGPLTKDISLEHLKTLAFRSGMVQSHYSIHSE